MNVERFTEKAREALSAALKLAEQHKNSQVDVEHVLAVLLRQDGGVVPQVIHVAGGNLAAAQRLMDAEIERMPYMHNDAEPFTSARLNKVLNEAEQEMKRLEEEYLSASHLSLAKA